MMTKRNQFTAVLGHEMRNSLTAIRGALDIWAERNPSNMDDLRHLFDRQLRLLTRLSEDLLGNERNGCGEMTMRQSPVALQPILIASVEQVQPSIKALGQKLFVEELDESIVVQGDADRLTQAFSNILQNASKFTQSLGSIFISLRAEGRFAVIRLRDTGQGIALNHLASVFEDGNTCNDTLPSEPEGFGFGLKLVKAVIESHGGSVAAESDGVGQGSEFLIRLPLLNQYASTNGCQTPHADHMADTVPTDLRESSSLRILIADDMRAIRELLGKLLEKIGHRVNMAKDGLEAFEMAARLRPQVVFLDLNMPGMNGFELCRRLRERFTSQEMILVAISGDDTEEYRLRARDAGIDAYLAKPVGISDLCEVLDAVRANRCFAGVGC